MFWAARVLHWCTQQVFFYHALKGWVICNMHRDEDRLLQLLILNEESLVSRSHQLGLITPLPFVHTAHCSYRLSDPVTYLDCSSVQWVNLVEDMSWTLLRRDRNKVSVGEHAERSFTQTICPQWYLVGSELENCIWKWRYLYPSSSTWPAGNCFAPRLQKGRHSWSDITCISDECVGSSGD